MCFLAQYEVGPQCSSKLHASLITTHIDTMSETESGVHQADRWSNKFLLEKGAIVGRLTLLKADPASPPKRKRWITLCSCGSEKSVAARHLRVGATKSCGCLLAENKTGETHGLSHVPEYKIWDGMICRCTQPSQESWKDYGGRGIKVCDRWRNSFEAFYADLGPRPSSIHCIERNDNDGNYEPCNCRWATRKEECRNRRSSKRITIKGVTKTLVEWTEVYNIAYKPVLLRINRRGWDPEVALSTPIKSNGFKGNSICYL